MSDPIDPEKLAKAIDFCGADVARAAGIDLVTVSVGRLAEIVAAARAHLATLPRFKEVEVKVWVIVGPEGRSGSFVYYSEDAARKIAESYNGDGKEYCAVALTGTAKVKVTP